MTDAMGALGTLAHLDCPERESALEAFYQRWQDDALVITKWFGLQATSSLQNMKTTLPQNAKTTFPPACKT